LEQQVTLFAIYMCSAYLNGQCWFAEGGKQTPKVTYPTLKACEKKINRAYAEKFTANETYECRGSEDGKWPAGEAATPKRDP
jgi:hypothetical protein